MSRKGFLPFATLRKTPSASFSILAAVFLEMASFRAVATLILLVLGAGPGLLLRLLGLELHGLLLFLHLRRRHLVRHLQELLLDGPRLLARDLADGGRHLF